MRILCIDNHRVTIEVDRTELDNIVNMMIMDQYNIGYNDGYNDYNEHKEFEWMKDASMDADRSEDDSQKDNS